MLPFLQASKCVETCMSHFSNRTNNYDVQIVGTICYYTWKIVIVIAIAYILTKFLSFLFSFLDRKDTKVDPHAGEKKLTPEDKERIAFYDFCFTMAKSTKPEEKELAEKCWETLKKRYVPTIQN